ncbi:hypothetical protein SDC9_175750 [bioreactor metagenome]|uniref:Uncharacterized protein n=1 Tax=bioreactor metagenome TaxID=1076179 RepID=A0A645GQZ2_9ZZZZ
MAPEAPRRRDDRNAALVKLIAHVFDKLRALADNAFVERFLKADGDSLHFTYAHAAVGQEPFEHGHQLLHLLAQLF